MNAGAYGGEMKDVLKEVTVLTPEGGVLTLQADELHMGYRTSVIKEAGYIVLEAVISLEKGDQEEIRSRMQELAGCEPASSHFLIQVQEVLSNGQRAILQAN